MKLNENFIEGVTKHLDKLDSEDTDKPIPRPASDDKKSVQEYRNKLHKKYPEALKEREDLPEYLNMTYENEKTPVKQLVDKAAKSSGISPGVFYTSAMEEGMRGIFPNQKGEIEYSGNKKYPISGFHNFGLDRFAEFYPGLVKKGYLPKGFEKNFQPETTENEKKEKVKSANFTDLESALQAKAAMMKQSQDEIEDYAKSHKIPLSNKAKEFFTLATFNAGIGNAEKMLSSYNESGYLKDDSFLKKQPSESWTGPYTNVMKRIHAAEALHSEGYF